MIVRAYIAAAATLAAGVCLATAGGYAAQQWGITALEPLGWAAGCWVVRAHFADQGRIN